MNKKWIITLLMVPTLFAGAQGIRLTKYDAPSAVYFDIESAINYNMYEHWRYQADVSWVYPNQNSAAAKQVKNQWRAKAYAGFTTGDADFKYGATGSVLLSKSKVKLSVSGFKDMFRAADRNLGTYSLLNPSANTGFVASYFVGVKGAMASAEFSPARKWNVTLGLRQTWEDYRFDAYGLIYPTIDPSRQTPVLSFSEVVARVEWDSKVILSLRGGHISNYSTNAYLKAILQYKQSYFNKSLNLFSQVGFATKNAPYSRMFDLGGTGHSGYFFNNTFLTVYPNRFAANTYALASINYTMTKPIWDLEFSKPKPFAQLNVMWGSLFGQDKYGQMIHDGLYLQSPFQGLLEPAAGIDGILRWGMVDFGIAVAYQLCPANAPYRYANSEDNFAFCIMGNLILDKYFK